MARVTLRRVHRVLGDYPAVLQQIADTLDARLDVGTDEAEQLRGIAAELENLTLAIVARLGGAR